MDTPKPDGTAAAKQNKGFQRGAKWLPPVRQPSSARSTVVNERSAAVMIQKRSRPRP
jgi:hypothetical protein